VLDDCHSIVTESNNSSLTILSTYLFQVAEGLVLMRQTDAGGAPQRYRDFHNTAQKRKGDSTTHCSVAYVVCGVGRIRPLKAISMRLNQLCGGRMTDGAPLYNIAYLTSRLTFLYNASFLCYR
jgi:hypothetical protein